MMQHQFKIVGGDTDSIMFCKPDMAVFTAEEQETLLNEINGLLPSGIRFKNDGIFPQVIYFATKNYVMIDSKGKKKIKGSSLKSSTIEPILKVMINEMIDLILLKEIHKIKSAYQKYIDMVENIQDITPWCSKKTLSPTTYNSPRKQETDIIDALANSEYRSGDRVYLYTGRKTIETGEVYKVGKKKGQPKIKDVRYLKLKENFQGDYCKEHYVSRVKKVSKIFESVLGDGFFDAN